MNTTNLETQLAAKIAALTGSETPQGLMLLKKACDNTKVDTTALDAAIQVHIDALNNSSSDKDLLVANRAALKNGDYSTPLMSNRKMPVSVVDAAALWIKTSPNVRSSSTAATFFNALGKDTATQGYKAKYVNFPNDALEHEVINLQNQAGVLTHVFSPAYYGANVDVTIKVVRDDEEFLFTGTLVDLSGYYQRLIVGDFPPYDSAYTSDSESIGRGTYSDSGWRSDNELPNVHMPTPAQTVIETSIGIPFTKSLIVSIWSSVAVPNNAHHQSAGVAYSTYIPQEF